MLFEAGLARGEGGLSPALLSVTGDKNDYAFLSLKSTAFDLTDRGVAGRRVPAGADAFVYAERGVYRSNETVYLTALLRDGQGNAITGAPMTLVVERPDGVEFRRAVVADQGAGGRTLSLALNSAVPTGTWRVRAFTDPKAPSVGETTFMVEDYIPERIEFSLTTKAAQIEAEKTVDLQVDGRFLYGAPASALQLEGDLLVKPAAARPGYAGYQFGVADDEETSNERTPLENLPETDAGGKATFAVSLPKPPTSSRPQEAQVFVRMAESGGRAVERKLTIPVAPTAAMIGIKPLFNDKSVAEGDPANFDIAFVAPDGKALARDGLALRTAQAGVALSMVPPGLVVGLRAGQDDQARRRWRSQRCARQAGAHPGVAAARPLPPRRQGRQRRRRADLDHLRRRLVFGRFGRHAGPARNLDRQGRVSVWRHDGGERQRPHRRQADHQRRRRSPAHHAILERQGRHLAGAHSGRQGLGHGRLCGRDPAPAARHGGPAHARTGDRPEMVRHRQEGAHARGGAVAAKSRAAQHPAQASRQDHRPKPRGRRENRRRRGRRRHPQSDQLQAARTGRALSRPAPADDGDPRPLRPIDRRHAGHARTDPHRWRRGQRRTARQPADAETAGPLLRHRHRRRRRIGGNPLRHSGVRRHSPRHGGRLERHESRQGGL